MATLTVNSPDRTEGKSKVPTPPKDTICYWPAVDILDTEDGMLLLADMPGLTPENIEVTLEQGILTVHGTATPRPVHGRRLLAEYAPGDYYRSFRVGDTIDQSKITAEYKDGVLQLHLRKVEAARPRKIAVRGA